MTDIERTATIQTYTKAVREIRQEIREIPSHMTGWKAMKCRLLARYRQILKEAKEAK